MQNYILVPFRFIMNCNMYSANTAVENSCLQNYALANNDFLDNNTIQSNPLDPDRSSDSLRGILNDLNIGYPEDNQKTIKMGVDNINTLQTSDATILNPTLIQSNEEKAQNYMSYPGKKISLRSALKIKLIY